MSEPVMVFVDLETTGLDCERDVITEMAWIINGTERHQYIAYEGFPSLWSARNTAAFEMVPSPSDEVGRIDLEDALAMFFSDCLVESDSDTPIYLVGACPAFDDRFLRKVFREVPYHYHVIDVEAMAMGALGWTYPRSLKELREALNISGENENPHNALADAREAQIIYEAVVSYFDGKIIE